MLGLSLFSGIGGLDIAFEMAGGQIVAMCEKEPFCQKVLKQHWPDIPIINDIKDVRGEDFSNVDIVFGSFPCQPFSVAGNQKGKEDERYLWPQFSRVVSEIKPRWVVAENVPGIVTIAADDIAQDLESKGYEVGIFNYEALSVGALHRRARIFFCGALADPNRQRCEEQRDGISAAQKLCGAERRGRRKPKPGLGGGFDGVSPWVDPSWELGIPRVCKGIPNRVSRLKALGNAVVPQQAYAIFRAIFTTDERCVFYER